MARQMIPVGKPIFDQEEAENILQALSREWITQGRFVAEFERRFAEFVGAKHAVAVSNGTAALHLALVALGIGTGDEVIVPATTFIATANAVAYTGATVVTVDVDPETWCLDLNLIEKHITVRTKAIIPVHLYGMPCDMQMLDYIAKLYGLYLIEDCAEALGAYCTPINGKAPHVGVDDHSVGCFSFYGNKTITTGEGGMVVTNYPELAEKLRLLRGQGQSDRRYWHEIIGYNYRMTDLQGALGCAQLSKLPGFLEKRYALLKLYQASLPESVQVQSIPASGKHGAWAMAVVFESGYIRFHVERALAKHHVETRPIFYPVNYMPPYKDNKAQPVAERLNECGLVLPLHPSLTEDQVKKICEIIIEEIQTGVIA